MPVADRKDPFFGFNFRVEIGSKEVGGFSEVTGLQIEVEVEDYREGGRNEYAHRIAGPVKYPSNLILKHGLTDVATLWDWHQKTCQGKIQRQNVSIILLDSTGQAQRRWDFAMALPVRWLGPDLRAGQSEIAVETLELVHRGLTPRG